ncbi:MAG: methyltransferase domain-containing protein [Candidatus Zixiibacteriota bacterium]
MTDNNPTLPVKHNPYLHDLVWGLLKDYPSGHLLDIPSGPGYFARQARQYGHEAVAAEIDEDLHVFEDVPYVKADMSGEFPWEENSFDYVVSIEGIEHIESQFQFLRECHRILKEGGRLFLTTPNVSSLESRLGFFLTGFHDNPPRPIRDDQKNIYMEHINLIPFHRLETYLRFAGFKIEILTTYRYRKGSRLLYPLVYLLARLRYRATFKKHFHGREDAERYRNIFKMYLSREVLCGSHNVVVAVKK